MRQANFPDQKALTARDETHTEPSQGVGPVPHNSGYLLFSGPRTEGAAGRKAPPMLSLSVLCIPVVGMYWPPSLLLWSSKWKADLLQLGAVTSLCKAATWMIQTRYFSWEPPPPQFHKGTTTTHFQTTSCHALVRMDSDRAHIVSLGCLLSSDKARGAHAPPLLDLLGIWGNVQGVRLLHSKTTEPTSVWCWASISPILVHWFFPHLGGLKI